MRAGEMPEPGAAGRRRAGRGSRRRCEPAGFQNQKRRVQAASCPIACRSCWAMTWPGSWFESDRECGNSKPATKSMRGQLIDRIGTFAEFIAVNENDVALKPKNTHHGRSGIDPAGRLDGLAGAGRKSQSEEGAEGLHPGGVRRRRHLRHSAGEASRRDGSDDDEQRQHRFGEEPRRRHRHRLQERRFRRTSCRTTMWSCTAWTR